MTLGTAARRKDLSVLGQRALAAATGTVAMSILAALLVVAILLAAIGQNPLEVYAALFEGSLTGRGLVTTLQRAVPLIGLSIALVFSFRAGVFNLGGEGQVVVGALAGTAAALAVPGPGIVVILVSCLVAMLASAALAAVPGLIQVKLGPPVLITSLLLNYVAVAGASWVIAAFLKDPQASEQSTRTISDDARIGAFLPADSPLGAAIGEALGGNNVLVLASRGLNWSFLIVIAIVLFTVFFNRRTVTGFESGVVGLNAHFAQIVGIRSDRVVMMSLMVGGAISGLIGMLLILGTNYRMIDGELQSTGFATTALLVVLLGRSTPLGVVLAGFFFSVLQVGGEQLNRTFALSPAIASIIQALVIFFVVLRVGIPHLTRHLRKRAEAAAIGATAEDVPDAVTMPVDAVLKKGADVE